jgi:L-seryl-tRNA(Ser) seleniumtransferase
MKNKLYKKIPKMDELLKDKRLEKFGKKLDYYSFSQGIREGLAEIRKEIRNEKLKDFSEEFLFEVLEKNLKIKSQNNLKPVINGTGTIIHTNLGRAILPKKILENITQVMLSYSNLEYDLETGRRGDRFVHIEKLICEITGAEGALVVNNNAAAVLLCLDEFAKGKSVIISRGELVEIGGSFRIPEIMKLSGAKLIEVGTTNRTYPEDYEKEIDDGTGVILKVHTSNFKVVGFTAEVEQKELKKIGEKYDVITMEDLGSGTLIDFSKYGLPKEPTVQESVRAGIDLITFSGDKLLGGPQAGIIVGKKHLIEKLKKNQLLRALRVSKLELAALEELFRIYTDEKKAIQELPTLKMILETPDSTLKRAIELQRLLLEKGIRCVIEKSEATLGGGSMPGEYIESYALVFEGNAKELFDLFKSGKIPIIGRITANRLILDLKTIQEKEFDKIVETVQEIYEKRIR